MKAKTSVYYVQKNTSNITVNISKMWFRSDRNIQPGGQTQASDLSDGARRLAQMLVLTRFHSREEISWEIFHVLLSPPVAIHMLGKYPSYVDVENPASQFTV